jgi:hypothetical protein
MSKLKLTQAQRAAKIACDQRMLAEAVILVQQGKGYSEIESILPSKGILDHNRKPYHNANISSTVIGAYPHLRRSAPKTKKKKKSKKSKSVKRRAKTSKRTTTVSASFDEKLVSAMKQSGISDSQILDVILKCRK